MITEIIVGFLFMIVLVGALVVGLYTEAKSHNHDKD